MCIVHRMANTHGLVERFWVAYSKTEGHGGTTMWDEDDPSLKPALDNARSVVDDRDADQARVTARLAAVDLTYTRSNGWQGR